MGVGLGQAWVEATAEVPASSANLGPGFDSLGLALELRLRVTMRARVAAPHPAGGGGWPPALDRFVVAGEAAGQVEPGPDNLVWKAALAAFEAMGPEPARQAAARLGVAPGRWVVDVEAFTSIPPASGLGSSAAAIVGGLWAANALFGTPLGYDRLLDQAARIEGHPDNVAPAALGGFVAAGIRDGRVVAVRVPMPRGEMVAVVAVPAMRLPTVEARRAVPADVDLPGVVFTLSGAALVVACATTGRWELLGQAMQDRLHQPGRFALVPGAREAMEGALAAGAYGACLSGAGPSVLALSAPWRAEGVGAAMQGAFARAGLACRALVLEPADEGVRVRIQRARPDQVEMGE